MKKLRSLALVVNYNRKLVVRLQFCDKIFIFFEDYVQKFFGHIPRGLSGRVLSGF